MRRFPVTVLFFLMVGLWCAALVNAGELSVELEGNGEAALIYFDTAGEALGAFQLELAYDPKMVQITGVKSGGNVYFGTPFARIDNTAGRVKLNAFQGSNMDEPVGYICLARIQLTLKRITVHKDNLIEATKALFVTPQGISIPVD